MDPGNTLVRAAIAAWVIAVVGYPLVLPATDCNGNGMEDIEEILRPVSAPNPPRWPAGDSPRDLVSGDIDGDDDLDLVVADFFRLIRVFRNQGGDFEVSAEMAVSIREESLSGATSASLVDLDRDGDLDLAAGITDWQAAHVYGALFTYENRGDGSFEEPAVLSLAGGLNDLEVLDIDGDGAMDAAGWSREDSTLTLFENTSGDLLQGGILDLEPSFSPFLSAADWNADGLEDLLLATHGDSARLSLLRNLRGSFSDAETLREGELWTFTTGDLSFDGLPDVVVSDVASDALLVFENVDGALSDPLQVVTGDPALSIHIADVDGDGGRDMAVILESGPISIIKQDDAGAFSLAGSYFAGRLIGNDLTTGDFDGDGLIDLVLTVSSSRSVALLRGRLDGTFVAPRVVERSNGDIAVLIEHAELTGDDSPDLVYMKVRRGTNEPIPIIIEENLGNGTFPSSAELEGHYSPVGFELLDVDLDGDLDVARGVRGGDMSLGLHENLGGGDFGPADWFATGGHMTSLHVGDHNDDGLPDVVMALEFPAGISVVPNDAEGAFRPPIVTTWLQTSFSPPVFLLPGDFDGDNHLDVLIGPYVENPAMLYAGRGTGRFEAPVRRFPVRFSYVAGAADLDRDGDADVLAAEHDPMSGKYEILAYVNDGAASFSLEQEIAIPERPQSMIVADLNGDAAPEAMVPCLGTPQVIDDGAVAVVMNDGAGGFSEAAPWLAGYRPAFAALGDIDGDGSHDLVVGAEGEHNGPPGELIVLDDVSRPASGTDADGDLILDACQSPPFHRGDANGDGDQDISDPLCVLNVLFVGRCRLDCLEAADANNDGVVDCSDAITILNWQFLGSEPPATPGPDGACGVDPDLRGALGFLDCERYSGCDGA